ncbi:hypothetical protein SAMN04489720_0991 [Agrococcus jejuensis]|uniref:Uncharacterized protein n=2 Tax=Agrococcus jejuensis TaxID=399736 RepID=A0A1G8BMF7_9MICO|nr:hypothetical protein SAMN04489720_0991 [Agrococcus jejuensis]
MTIDAPHARATPRLDPSRGTSIAIWACMIAVVAVLIAVRLPQLERLVTERTSDLLVELADPELGAASVRVGAVTAIVLFIAVGIVIALVVGLLERWLGPRALAPRPWARLGAGGAMVGLVGIGLQVAAVALAVPSVEKSALVLVGILAIAALMPLAFRDGRTRTGYLRSLAVTVAAGMLLWLQ